MDLQVSCDRLAEIGEPAVGVPLPRDQLAGAVVDVGPRTEPVELHLLEEVGVVEGSGDLEEVHRFELGEGTHGKNLAVLSTTSRVPPWM